MRGVDLARWRFDWDLTFAVLIADPDGTVLGRYGGRDERGADHWLTEASYARFLEGGLRAYAEHESRAVEREELHLEDVPAFAARDDGQCIHCHSVFPALREQAIEEGTWKRSGLWVYPSPGRIGLDLDRDQQTLITHVGEASPAGRAGLKPGERIARLGGVSIVSASDLMYALDRFDEEGGELSLSLASGRRVWLRLEPGWKRATPREFAWRPSKWGLTPAPGFGGPALTASELTQAGLDPGSFAFRVDYLVTWGENARFGRGAREQGLRKGEIVLGTSLKRDFDSVDHFHAWWRLTRRPSEHFDLLVWRGGKVVRLPWRVVE